MPEIPELTALELRQAYRSRELSPVEALDAIFARIDLLEPSLHAFITETRELAMRQAREAEGQWLRSERWLHEPLMGIPLTIKDLVDVEGVPTTMGSLVTSREPVTRDELFVQLLRVSGAIFLGKTNTSEFGLAAQTANRLGPATANPWDVERTAGGSSGGAAAACAAGFGPLHHGTDGGGSVRIPAGYCGVIGLKPTGRRVARSWRGAGMSQISTDGVLARTVADAALMLGVIARGHPHEQMPYRTQYEDAIPASIPQRLDRLRIAFTTQLGWPTPCEPLIADRVRVAADVLRQAGASLEREIPDISDPNEVFPVLSAVGAAANYGPMCVGRMDELSDYTRASVERGRALSGVQVAEAYAALDRLRQLMNAWFDRYDVLLTPTSAITAHRHGERIDQIAGQRISPWTASILYTPLANLIQAPAIAMPAGVDRDGLPISVQLMGRPGEDATVIRCAAMLEDAGFGGPIHLAPV